MMKGRAVPATPGSSHTVILTDYLFFGNTVKCTYTVHRKLDPKALLPSLLDFGDVVLCVHFVIIQPAAVQLALPEARS